MKWNNLVVKSVKDVFSAVEPVLGTKEAGRILGINPKGDEIAKIDKIAESAYLSNLPSDVSVVSEESEKRPGSSNVVIIDPVCMSIIAKRGSRHFATGIAVYTSSMQPVAEAIGIFETGDVYHADENGAYKNGKAIHVSGTKTIEDSVLYCEMHLPGERTKLAKTTLFSKAPHMFAFGIKLAIAQFSGGLVDGFASFSDYPATELIGINMIKKAGGIVSDVKGNEIRVYPDMKHRTTLMFASTKELHAAMLKLL